MWRKRVDAERFQLMRFEDAIVDAAMEMVHRGEMTALQEKMWYSFFAEKYEMTGLMPGPASIDAIKRAIRGRLKTFYTKKPMIPGGLPEIHRDPDYNSGVLKSKYVG